MSEILYEVLRPFIPRLMISAGTVLLASFLINLHAARSENFTIFHDCFDIRVRSSKIINVIQIYCLFRSEIPFIDHEVNRGYVLKVIFRVL